jgi:hypothetical protein
MDRMTLRLNLGWFSFIPSRLIMSRSFSGTSFSARARLLTAAIWLQFKIKHLNLMGCLKIDIKQHLEDLFVPFRAASLVKLRDPLERTKWEFDYINIGTTLGGARCLAVHINPIVGNV